MYNREDFVSNSDWKKFLEFSKNLETPNIVVNVNTVRKNFIKLRDSFPYARIYYAMKANPGEPVLKMLIEEGCCFDIASRYELDKILALGAKPDNLSYGNTIKKARDVKYFYEKGVRMFATDSKEDLKNIAEFAPKSRVYVRILVENSVTADWPLSRKFGCHPDMAYDLLVQARDMGLTPYGISFHVGSQQRDIGQWNDAIAKAKYLFNSLEEEEDIKLTMINMGGGFPASYIEPTNTLDVYASEITRYLQDDFGEDIPEIARILGVADSYDAMASDRSYRKALPQEVVRAEIEKGKGKQFDAKIADIMLQMIDDDKDYSMKQSERSSKNILVVDDEVMNIKMVEFILKDIPDFHVIGAKTMEETFADLRAMLQEG